MVAWAAVGQAASEALWECSHILFASGNHMRCEASSFHPTEVDYQKSIYRNVKVIKENNKVKCYKSSI